MQFYPADAHVPEMLTTDEFTLRPLMPEHVALDHAALMTSKEMLRLWSAQPKGGWPDDDFSVEDNLKDMEWHYGDHLARTAFTFTVLNPAEDEVLGCVYIVPFAPLMKSNPHLASMIKDSSGLVRFWVVEPRLADGLDERLLRAMLGWFDSKWAFEEVYFHTYVGHSQQISVFEKCGLAQVGQIEIPRRGNPFLLYQKSLA